MSASSDGPGKGSEFVVRLPRVTAGSIPDEAPVDKLAPVSAVPRRSDSPRILVVDDSVDGAEMLATALTAKGYDTRVAHDAPSALRIASEFRPAVGFLDIGLPVMDGYELAAHLRELPELNGMKLIALTGYGQESDRRKSREAGFDHHLVKPVDFTAVESVLAECNRAGDSESIE